MVDRPPRLIVTNPASLPRTVRVTESLGIRRIQFSDAFIQGVMKVDDPDRLLLDYAHKMMAWIGFGLKPRMVLVIGLGAGSIVRFILRYFPNIFIDVVEIDRRIIKVCHDKFLLPRSDPRLRVHFADGLEYVPDAARRGVRWDLILVDAYGECPDDRGFGTPGFLRACAAVLEEQGMVVMNVIGRSSADRPHRGPLMESFGANIRYMTATTENNIIVMAGKNRHLHLPLAPHADEIAKLDLRSELWTFR